MPEYLVKHTEEGVRLELGLLVRFDTNEDGLVIFKVELRSYLPGLLPRLSTLRIRRPVQVQFLRRESQEEVPSSVVTGLAVVAVVTWLGVLDNLFDVLVGDLSENIQHLRPLNLSHFFLLLLSLNFPLVSRVLVVHPIPIGMVGVVEGEVHLGDFLLQDI